MCYYYYKDGEKIGPVDYGELRALAKWGDLTPETTIEKEDGIQAPASEIFLPSAFGTNPSGLSLDAARRRAVACERLKIRCLFVILILFVVTGAAGFTYNRVLIGIPFVALIIVTGVLISVAVFAHKARLDKVPPKPKED
ncbi:MAG: DUF4339 domain-containing protein [Thermoguttaceae bacterium]|nr:DUF4339 domain-containing protein [Thermoguttaceae bacterium]